MNRNPRGSVLILLLFVATLVALTAALSFRILRRAVERKRLVESAQSDDQDAENQLTQSIAALDNENPLLAGAQLRLLSAPSGKIPGRLPLALLVDAKNSFAALPRSPDWTRLEQTSRQMKCPPGSKPGYLPGRSKFDCENSAIEIDDSLTVFGNLGATVIGLRCAAQNVLHLAIEGELVADEIDLRSSPGCRVEILAAGEVRLKQISAADGGELLLLSASSGITVGNSAGMDFCSVPSTANTVLTRFEARRISLGGVSSPPPFLGCELPLNLLFWPALKVVGEAYF